MTLLLLGGTAEARALALVLADLGRPAISSLAGRVSDPALPAGRVRIGGFGGPDGLRAFLAEQQVAAIVDATHPFAAQISRYAVVAAEAAGIPLLRLTRPGWTDHPQAAHWSWVKDEAEARRAAGAASRPFLTTGRQSLQSFLLPWTDRQVLVRVVDPPEFNLPPGWRLVRSRGPYGYQAERQLMTDHLADLLVSKDSGGSATSAKLDVAADLGIPVVMISRPEEPGSVPRVATVAEALAWCIRR